MAPDLEGDVIENVDGAGSGSEPSIRDTVRDAYDKAVEGAGEQKENAAPAKGRDGQGRFSSDTQAADRARQAADAKRVAQGGPQSSHPSQNVADPAQAAPQAAQPPVGWSADAKAAFGTLPPAVQQAVAAREEQVNNGFRVLQNYKGLENFKPYVDKAGVTYHEVFDRAVKWEQATLSDPIGTIMHLAKIRGITPQLLGRAIADPRVAQSIRIQLAQRQGQPQPGQQPQPQTLTADQARALAREEFQRAKSEDAVNTDVSSFLADPAHPHAEALADDMVMLINAGRAEDLKGAYQMALRMHPELVPAINRPGQNTQSRQQAVSNARAAAKAVTGAPVASLSTPKSQNPNQSLRDTIREAYHAQRGSIDD